MWSLSFKHIVDCGYFSCKISKMSKKKLIQTLRTLLLIQMLLLIGGVETNPGPEIKECKGHQHRSSLDSELEKRRNQFYEAKQVKEKKVFEVSLGPTLEFWSLLDFEKKFQTELEWKRMSEDVWVVPTMNLVSLLPNKDNPEGRLSSCQTTEDVRSFLLQEFKNNICKVNAKILEKERKRTDPVKLEIKIRNEAIKLTEKDPLTPLYKDRLGDIAEITLVKFLKAALSGIPSLILRGLKTFHDFPKTLENAGIFLSERAENDIIVLIPAGDILHVRYIEVKRQVIMPWEEDNEKKVHEQLIKGMYKQLQKDITSFYDLFPDLHPSQIDLEVIGSLPFSTCTKLFCKQCIQKTITAEDCAIPLTGKSILEKMKLDIGQIKDNKTTDKGMALFKHVATRFVSSFSIAQKSCKTFEAGFKEGSRRLAEVHDKMELAIQEQIAAGETVDSAYIFKTLGPGKTGPERSILLSKDQSNVRHGELASTFIYGGFGTGKTELAFQITKKFCDHVIKKFASRGLVIVSIFSDRGYCDKLMKEYKEMLDAYLKAPEEFASKYLGNPDSSLGLSTMVCVKEWLLKRYHVKSSFKNQKRVMWNLPLCQVINGLMKRIVEVHPNDEILLVLDEVSSPFQEGAYDWSILDVPERLKLVLVLKPTKNTKAKFQSLVLPNEDKIRVIYLNRQYRSSGNIQEFIRIMSFILDKTERFTSLLPDVFFSQMGHEIPGDVIDWYALKGDARDEPDLTELKVTVEHILKKLREDSINLADVAIVAEGGEILMLIKKVCSPSWPKAFHTQSFMGCEAPVVIWVSSGVYLDRQLESASRAMMKLVILTCEKSLETLCTTINQGFPHLLVRKNVPKYSTKEYAELQSASKNVTAGGGGDSMNTIMKLVEETCLRSKTQRNSHPKFDQEPKTSHGNMSESNLKPEEVNNLCESIMDDIIELVLKHEHNEYTVPSGTVPVGERQVFKMNPGGIQERTTAYVNGGLVPLPNYQGWHDGYTHDMESESESKENVGTGLDVDASFKKNLRNAFK